MITGVAVTVGVIVLVPAAPVVVVTVVVMGVIAAAATVLLMSPGVESLCYARNLGFISPWAILEWMPAATAATATAVTLAEASCGHSCRITASSSGIGQP